MARPELIGSVASWIGTGTMGQGIAQVTASCGYATRLVDDDISNSERAIAAIGVQLDRLVAEGK